jgi:glutamate--cysteine ligase
MDAIRVADGSYTKFALQQSKRLADEFRAHPPSAEQQTYYTKMAQQSLAEQAQMESTQTGSFDQFIADYRSRTSSEICCESFANATGTQTVSV